MRKNVLPMASLALLRVSPLLCATSYVTFTFSEDTFIRPLIHTAPSTTDTELRRHSNRILPSFNRFTRRGLPFIFISYPLSIATAAANLRQLGPSIILSGNGELRCRTAAMFYLAGLVFSALHFSFGPAAMACLKRVSQDKRIHGDFNADNTANLVSWLRINTVRGAVADLPSWLCYIIAFMLAME